MTRSATDKPSLLDLFCKAGGCTKGYQRAGFYVVGVDVEPQPNYCGDEFIEADALDVLAEIAEGATHFSATGRTYSLSPVAIHASPPCQAYSQTQRIRCYVHPDLIGATRAGLLATGLPYMIENVPGAPLIDSVILEGQMFDGLRTIRPRHFETNWPLDVPFLRPSRPRQAKMGRRPRDDEWMQIVGNFSDADGGRTAMGIDWMTRDELREAIPPAYTELIGHQLMDYLRATVTT